MFIENVDALFQFLCAGFMFAFGIAEMKERRSGVQCLVCEGENGTRDIGFFAYCGLIRVKGCSFLFL